MAPEEFRLGEPLDQRTTVFNLGRLVGHFGTRLTERSAMFVGSADLAAVVQQACAHDRTARQETVAELANAWASARSA